MTAALPPPPDAAPPHPGVVGPAPPRSSAGFLGRLVLRELRVRPMTTAASGLIGVALGLALATAPPGADGNGRRALAIVLLLALAAALADAQRETRNFAKRQTTWFANQTPGWMRSS